jgi:hypothetical protein
VDERIRKKIHKISKMAWDDFLGGDYVYLSLVQFLDSSIVRKV